jgi:hypothetical protein
MRDLANYPKNYPPHTRLALPSVRIVQRLRYEFIKSAEDVALSFTTVSAKPVRSTVNSRTVALSRRTQILSSVSKWPPCSYLGQNGQIPPWN